MSALSAVFAIIFVSPCAMAQQNATLDSPYQVKYVGNLGVGDSFIAITNSGARGATLAGGTTASTTGAICGNVYTFAPDEQMMSCCSYLVAPSGLVSISAWGLVINSTAPFISNSIVIKVLASTPVGGTCDSSAAAPGPATSGLIAFGTTIHAGPGGNNSLTESRLSMKLLG